VKGFNKRLFSRRFTLFMDFIKLTRLFAIRKINIKAYIYALALVFKGLHKKVHGLFFIFLKTIMYRLIKDHKSAILGVKVIISGKLKGKQMASLKTISIGKLGTSTISADMNFARIHLYTLYGCYGIKF
jgi:ribosomal protein S3